jgi:hypothetical protein
MESCLHHLPSLLRETLDIQEMPNVKRQVLFLLGDQFTSLELISTRAIQIKMILSGVSGEFVSTIPAPAMEKLGQDLNSRTCLFDLIRISNDRDRGTSTPLFSLLARCRRFQTTDNGTGYMLFRQWPRMKACRLQTTIFLLTSSCYD